MKATLKHSQGSRRPRTCRVSFLLSCFQEGSHPYFITHREQPATELNCTNNMHSLKTGEPKLGASLAVHH